MNKITKKLISGIAALSMLIPLYSAVHVSADDPSPSPVPNITRTLSVKFMGRGATPQETSPGAAKLNADDLQASNPNKQEFWVGVSVDKVNDLDLFKNGIYSLELAFEYDPSFIEPYYTSNQAETDWNKELIKGNLKAATDTDFSESAWWDSSKYEITSVFGSELDMETDSGVGVDREDADKVAARKAAGWKMCTVCVNYKPDVTFENARFNGLADDGEKFLLKLPFKVKKVPGDSDTNKNPKVLSLVRGPETLDIGSGANGKTPHSTWIKTVTDWTDQSNMKTLFKDSGDISLFGAGAVIEDIDPYDPPEPTQGPDATPDPDATPKPTDKPLPDLSHTKEDLGEEGFNDGVKTYYMSVPNEEDTIQFDVVYADTPTVKVRYTDNPTDTEVNVTEVDGKKRTDPIPLKELTKETAAGATKGYDNIITFSDNSTDYEIHIRRLLKPQIVLNPGNSPYGEIERMAEKYLPDDQKDQAWDEAKIQQAKEEFNKKNRFVKNYTPIGQTTKAFSPKAWGFSSDAISNKPENVNSPNNLDRNIYSIFVYNKNSDNSRNFKDPGFAAVNSLGEIVEETSIKRTLKIKRMKSNNLSSFRNNPQDDEIVVENAINNVLIDLKLSATNLGSKGIAPGIYTMEYTFTDSYTKETVLQTRPVIMLWPLCDVDLSNIINSGDASTVTSKVKGVSNPTSGLDEKLTNLYLYRIMDVDRSGIINSGDASTVTSKVKGVSNPTPYYSELK